jgi:diguanylate cyclase (GGDEF)-like protein
VRVFVVFGGVVFMLSLLAGGSPAAWAVQLNIEHYDTRDGIPQVQVLAVNQCSEGYIWLGTFSGLSRFNGREFRHFSARDGLRSNYITALEKDAAGHLWVATSAGLCRVAGRDRFVCSDHAELRNVHVHDLHTAGETLWVASDAGLVRIEGESVQSVDLGVGAEQPRVLSVASTGVDVVWVGTDAGLFVLTKDDPTDSGRISGLPVMQVTALAADEEGVWIGSGRGLFRWEGGALVELEDPLLAEQDVAHLLVDDLGRLWASTASGLVRVEDGRVDYLKVRNGLASDLLRQVFIDREGIVWVAHDSGLSKLLPSEFVGYNIDSDLLSSFVRTLAEDQAGRLWLGTRNGVQIVSRVDGQWHIDSETTITTADGLADERIYSIAFANDGSALLATSQGVVHWREGEGVVGVLEEADGLPSNRARALLHDSRGRTWVSTDAGTVLVEEGAVRPAPAPELAAAYAMRIREDDAGRIWFATLQHGLFMLEPSGASRQWRAEHGLSDEMLWDVMPSDSGSVWVGSNGDGLFYVDVDGPVKNYTVEDGLADNFVWQVLVDDDGMVWAYTNRGLSRFNGSEFESYGESDGLLHLEGAATAALQASDGTRWFGSADGLMRYEPDGRGRGDVPPGVVIEEVTLGGRVVEPSERLPHRPGSLQVRFAGLSFINEDAVTFRYRLSGIENDWTDGGNTGSVTYASLGSGEYVFEVQARNAHGVWSSETARFAFGVETPFWGTWWFWSAMLIGGVLLARTALHLRERAVQVRQLELEQIVKRRTAELSEANRRLEHASRTDPLTGLPNRRHLLDRIDQDVAEARRRHSDKRAQENRDMIFMMIDLDHFKSINDRFGHDAGDQVLCEMARILATELRASDDLIRWGGEEFLVVARNAEASLARNLADRIVCAARNHKVNLKGTDAVIVPTCSVGISTYPFFHERPELLDWEQAIQLADIAVYMAKNNGRDGWVWLRPGVGSAVDDGAIFVEQVRESSQFLLDAGNLSIESSHK